MECCAFSRHPWIKYMFPKMAEEMLKATGRYMLCAVLSATSEVYRHEACMSDS